MYFADKDSAIAFLPSEVAEGLWGVPSSKNHTVVIVVLRKVTTKHRLDSKKSLRLMHFKRKARNERNVEWHPFVRGSNVSSILSTSLLAVGQTGFTGIAAAGGSEKAVDQPSRQHD